MDHDETVEEFEIDLSILDDGELADFAALLKAEYDEKRAKEEFGQDDLGELKQIAEVIKYAKEEMAARLELAETDAAVEADEEFNAFQEYMKRKGLKQSAVADDTEDTDVEATADEAEELAEEKVSFKDKNVNVVISPKGIEGDKPVVASATRSGRIAVAGDVRGYKSGEDLTNLNDIAKAFVAKRPDVRGTDQGRDGATFLVASVYNDYDEDRSLTMDLESNMRKIQAVTSPQAIVASGGLCAPLQPKFEINVFGEASRPVRDSLASFKAERGGIRWLPSPVLTDLDGQSRVTTNTQDAAGYSNQDPAGSTDPKPSIHVTCPSEQTKKIDAYSKSLTFGNMSTRTYPEQVEAWLKLGMVEFAKYTEIALLDAIDAASVALTAAQVYSATFSFLEQIEKVVTNFRSRHRSPNTTMRVLFPWWVKTIIRADIAGRGPGDGLGILNVSDAQVQDWFETRNVKVSWYQDNTTAVGAQFSAMSAGALYTWPTTVTWFVYPEGHFLFLDGGSLDLGLVRDSTLNSQNDYQVFYEEFFGLAAVGLTNEAYKVTSTIKPDASTAPAAAALRS